MSLPDLGNQAFSKVQNAAGTGLQSLLVDSFSAANSKSSLLSVGVETLTHANNGGNVSLDVFATLLNDTGGSFSVTLGNGKYVGQIKSLTAIYGNSASVSIPNMYVYNGFNNSIQNEYPLLLLWDGIKWAALCNIDRYD